MKPAPGFDPKSAAKKLLREARSGALATLMPGSGDPYCSLVNVASAPDGSPLLLLSRLAVHTGNLLSVFVFQRQGAAIDGGLRPILQPRSPDCFGRKSTYFGPFAGCKS